MQILPLTDAKQRVSKLSLAKITLDTHTAATSDTDTDRQSQDSQIQMKID